jgi:uncharacterized protein YjbI with pentapeptide repeats
MSNVSLTRTDLAGAVLDLADLANADLSGAHLAGAHLSTGFQCT